MQSLQSFVTLAVHAKAMQSQKILEVACGGGVHSLFLAKTLLQRGGTLVCTDFSDEMLRRTRTKFEDPGNDYIQIPGNKVKVVPDP